MPHYLIQGSYTPEAWTRLMKTPEDRAKTVRPIIESIGGRLESLYFSFGDADVVALFTTPDNVSAAALAIAVTSSGSFSAFKTTVLMTSAEARTAMKKANSIAYRAPGSR
jgi:uncharacterized protein with GYD domain